MSLSKYFNDLGNQNIKTHKDALKYDAVRFSSYHNSYPKDCTIPACVLSDYGFHYDDLAKKIRCIECHFQYENLYADSLGDILSHHYKTSKACQQAKLSLARCISEWPHETVVSSPKRQTSVEELEFIEKMSSSSPPTATQTSDYSKKMKRASPLSLAQSQSLQKAPALQQQQHHQMTARSQYQNEESRRVSFEGFKMLFDAKTLAANGFYKVNVETSGLSSSMFRRDGSMETDLDDGLTHIEQLARNVPALMHIKCVFCSYECLIFRNSLLNTLYKSPFDEHREKSRYKCQVFAQETTNKRTSLSAGLSRESLAKHQESVANAASKSGNFEFG